MYDTLRFRDNTIAGECHIKNCPNKTKSIRFPHVLHITSSPFLPSHEPYFIIHTCNVGMCIGVSGKMPPGSKLIENVKKVLQTVKVLYCYIVA